MPHHKLFLVIARCRILSWRNTKESCISIYHHVSRSQLSLEKPSCFEWQRIIIPTNTTVHFINQQMDTQIRPLGNQKRSRSKLLCVFCLFVWICLFIFNIISIFCCCQWLYCHLNLNLEIRNEKKKCLFKWTNYWF